MRVEIDYGPFEWTRKAERALEHATDRLRARVGRYGLAPSTLEATFWAGEGGLVGCRARISVPGRTFASDFTAPGLIIAIQEAMGDLRRQFDRWRWSRHPALSEVRRRSHLDPEVVDDVLRRALPVLERVAREEIALRETRGDLADGTVDPSDVIDDAIADVLPDLANCDSAAQALVQLESRVLTRIADAVAAADSDPEAQGFSLDSTQEQIADDPWRDRPPLTLGETVADADALGTDEVIARQEAREELVEALLDLPSDLRRTFELAVLEGLGATAVARAWKRDAAEVEAMIDDATEKLRARLFPNDGHGGVRVRDLYRVLGDELREEWWWGLSESAPALGRG